MATVDIAAAHCDVRRARLEHRQQVGQPLLIMLQIAIHHGDVFGRGRQRALDHRRSEATPANALYAANARVPPSKASHLSSRAVWAIVVHKYSLPGNLCKRGAEF